MAKGEKKGGKAKKAKPAKEAKEAAGVKLPKGLRKAGKKALKLAGEPVVGETVAAALLAAAAALREAPAAKRGARTAGEAALEGGEEVAREVGKIGESLRAFAIDMARRTLDAWEDKGSGGGPKSG
jgi:hypothetical protein